MVSIVQIEARINVLEQRDPVANARIIKKLKRRLRRLESEVN